MGEEGGGEGEGRVENGGAKSQDPARVAYGTSNDGSKRMRRREQALCVLVHLLLLGRAGLFVYIVPGRVDRRVFMADYDVVGSLLGFVYVFIVCLFS